MSTVDSQVLKRRYLASEWGNKLEGIRSFEKYLVDGYDMEKWLKILGIIIDKIIWAFYNQGVLYAKHTIYYWASFLGPKY